MTDTFEGPLFATPGKVILKSVENQDDSLFLTSEIFNQEFYQPVVMQVVSTGQLGKDLPKMLVSGVFWKDGDIVIVEQNSCNEDNNLSVIGLYDHYSVDPTVIMCPAQEASPGKYKPVSTEQVVIMLAPEKEFEQDVIRVENDYTRNNVAIVFDSKNPDIRPGQRVVIKNAGTYRIDISGIDYYICELQDIVTRIAT